MGSPRLVAALLLLAAAGTRALDASSNECSFVELAPRYYTLEATVQVMGARSDILLSDALLRSLRGSFGLPECAALLSEGQKCGASLAEIPCQDPFYLCGGTVVVAASLYQAASSGICNLNKAIGDSSVCQALARYPDVAQYAEADLCVETCIAGVTTTTSSAPGPSSDGSIVTLAAPPPPSVADDESCFSYSLQVRTATEKQAAGVAAGLRSTGLMANLTAAATPFAAESGTPVDIYIATDGAPLGVGLHCRLGVLGNLLGERCVYCIGRVQGGV